MGPANLRGLLCLVEPLPCLARPSRARPERARPSLEGFAAVEAVVHQAVCAADGLGPRPALYASGRIGLAGFRRRGRRRRYATGRYERRSCGRPPCCGTARILDWAPQRRFLGPFLGSQDPANLGDLCRGEGWSGGNSQVDKLLRTGIKAGDHAATGSRLGLSGQSSSTVVPSWWAIHRAVDSLGSTSFLR